MSLLKEINSIFLTQMNGKGLKFEFQEDLGDEIINLKLLTDKKRLKQVLLNIISNSLKFTMSGSITVFTVLKGDMIEFTIKDTGLGMTEE